MSRWVNVEGGNCRGGKCHGGNCHRTIPKIHTMFSVEYYWSYWLSNPYMIPNLNSVVVRVRRLVGSRVSPQTI